MKRMLALVLALCLCLPLTALAQEEDWTVEDWKRELHDTLAHEFTHHIEGLAGERGLELKDAQFMEDFRARNGE